MLAGEEQQETMRREREQGYKIEKGQTETICTFIQREWSNMNYFLQWCFSDTAEGALFDLLCPMLRECSLRPTHKIQKAIIFVKRASNSERLLTITHIPLHTYCQSAINHTKPL